MTQDRQLVLVYGARSTEFSVLLVFIMPRSKNKRVMPDGEDTVTIPGRYDGGRSHLQKLGLTSVFDYFQWCKQHGFKKSLNKSYRDRESETLVLRRQGADAHLREQKKINRSPQQNLVAAIKGEIAEYPADIKASINNLKPSSQKAFKELTLFVAEQTDSLFDRMDNTQNNNRFVDALLRLADYELFWIRPFKDWRCKTHNSYRQLISLIHHLLVKYDMPAFMEKCWWSNNTHPHQEWYIHLGEGHNIRTAKFIPFEMTKRMAHFFMMAPQDYSIQEAFHYGKILALGGHRPLVDALRPTLIIDNNRGAYGSSKEFWDSVIRWFIANPMLDLDYVTTIVDYLYNQKFVRRREPVGLRGEYEDVPPPQPNLSMAKRDPEATIKAAERWHKQLGKAKKRGTSTWVPSYVMPFSFEEGTTGESRKHWTIRELLSSNELIDEGRVMKHCVSSYASSCASGSSAIFSLRCNGNRVLTIQVSLTNRTVIQARGKLNVKSTPKEMSVIQRWAAENNLQVTSYV